MRSRRHFRHLSPMIGAALLLAPPVAMANGNSLAMSGAIYDPGGGRFGLGGLKSGSGISTAGACYETAIASRTFALGQPSPNNSASKSVWFSTSSAPSTATMIFSDSVSGIGISPSGTPVFAALGTTVTLPYSSSNNIANGAWHDLEVDLVPQAVGLPNGLFSEPSSGPSPFYTVANFYLDGVLQSSPTVLNAPLAASYSALSQVQTTVSAAGGEVSEAACFTPYLHAYNYPVDAFSTSLGALLADWNFNGNGLDSATAPSAATSSW